MAHFAKVVDGKVTQVIVAEPDFFDTFIDSSPGDWIQTSYNTYGGQHSAGKTPLRKNFASIGFIYHKEADAFSPPQPFSSWSLNQETFLWEPPVAYPEDGQKYIWDEETLNWIKVEE